MRSVLLHIHDDDCMEARLQTALDLARQFDGHLTCVQAVAFEFGVPGDFYGTVASQMATVFRETADRVQEELEDRLKRDDVQWDWFRSDGGAALHLAQHAPLNDIVVVGARNPAGKPDSPSTLVSDLVMNVRAPLLVAPAAAHEFSLDGTATIAWNGSSEGAHALRAAVPLLAKASEVHVLTVHEKEEPQSPYDMPSTDAAKYLARHGIEANIVDLPAEDDLSIADVLTSASQARKAAYIVMGAYGHSRFRERVLGGVTRDMLRDPQIPLFLSH